MKIVLTDNFVSHLHPVVNVILSIAVQVGQMQPQAVSFPVPVDQAAIAQVASTVSRQLHVMK